MHELEDQLLWAARQVPWPVAIAALVAVVIVLVRSLSSRTDVGGQSAPELLDKLFAAGRISIEEYEKRKRKLAHTH